MAGAEEGANDRERGIGKEFSTGANFRGRDFPVVLRSSDCKRRQDEAKRRYAIPPAKQRGRFTIPAIPCPYLHSTFPIRYIPQMPGRITFM